MGNDKFPKTINESHDVLQHHKNFEDENENNNNNDNGDKNNEPGMSFHDNDNNSNDSNGIPEGVSFED